MYVGCVSVPHFVIKFYTNDNDDDATAAEEAQSFPRNAENFPVSSRLDEHFLNDQLPQNYFSQNFIFDTKYNEEKIENVKATQTESLLLWRPPLRQSKEVTKDVAMSKG